MFWALPPATVDVGTTHETGGTMRRCIALICALAASGCSASAAGEHGASEHSSSAAAQRQNLATVSVVDGGIIDIVNETGVVADAVSLAPGGTSGWHTHPAPELVLVKSGELTFYRSDRPGCVAGTFSAGEAFVGPPGAVPQMATNTGDERAELVVVFFGIPDGGHVREDVAKPDGCPAI
jgi:quercetin dioxygenase-like cupin family protein